MTDIKELEDRVKRLEDGVVKDLRRVWILIILINIGNLLHYLNH